MEATTAKALDLRLAYERVRRELGEQARTERALAANPFELELIEQDLEAWLADLERRVEGRAYVPGPIEVCDAPKGGGLVRPGVRLGVADRVVYTAAVGACIDQIDAATRWSQGKCDFAMRLNPAKLHEGDWLRNPFRGWKEFRDRSLKRLDSKSVRYVLTADVAGYFENIHLGLLMSELQRLGCPTEAIELIRRCLNNWVQCPDRGLPQGVMASDVLAKLYLESFDRRLQESSFLHMRYTDDLRVFAKTEEEAQRALVIITRILRERGLTLQSKKTKIRTAEEAREEFDGIIPAIEEVRRGYINEVRAAGLMSADESLPMAEIDALVAEDEIEPEVLHRAFDVYVVKAESPDKSMLNFLLNHLGKLGDEFAIEECSTLLESHPERTGAIIRYFQALERTAELEPVIATALASESAAIYPYKRYLLLDWLVRNAEGLADETLAIVRQLASNPQSLPYVQAVALQLLGRFGTHADLDELEGWFKAPSEPLRRAQLLCCLQRLEKSRRNGLAARVAEDDGWIGKAAVYVRA